MIKSDYIMKVKLITSLQTKGEKAHGFNRGMIAPKMCVYNLNLN